MKVLGYDDYYLLINCYFLRGHLFFFFYVVERTRRINAALVEKREKKDVKRKGNVFLKALLRWCSAWVNICTNNVDMTCFQEC